MKPNFKYKFSQEFFIHLFAWIFLFGLPPMLIGRMNEPSPEGEFLRMAGPPIAMSVIFYINYLWLVPGLLLKKKYNTYIFINICICFALLGFIHLWFEMCNTYYPFSNRPKQCTSPDLIKIFLFRLRDFILFGVMAALAAIIRMSKKWHEAESARQIAELQRTEAELRNLRNQINPHFLLNTLNNIYALIAFESDKAQQAVLDLSRLLRHLLYDNNQEFVPLNRELDFLKNYVALMKIRLSKNVDLRFHIDLSKDNNMQIAPLIFISLVENAFKHGISPVKPSFIHIRLYSEAPDTLTCLIENSNFPKKRNDISGSGIGLEQVQKRLDRTYPNRYEWHRGSNPEATVYTSKLTINITNR